MRIITKRLDTVNFLRFATRIYSRLANGGQSITTNNDTHNNHFIRHFKLRSGPDDEKLLEQRRAALENEFFYKEQQRLLRKLRERLKERRNQDGLRRRFGTSDKTNKRKTEEKQWREKMKPDLE